MQSNSRLKLILACNILSLLLLATAVLAFGSLAGLAKLVMMDEWEEMWQAGVINKEALAQYRDGRFAQDRFLLGDYLARQVIHTAADVPDWLVTAVLVVQGVSLFLVWRQMRDQSGAGKEQVLAQVT